MTTDPGITAASTRPVTVTIDIGLTEPTLQSAAARLRSGNAQVLNQQMGAAFDAKQPPLKSPTTLKLRRIKTPVAVRIELHEQCLHPGAVHLHRLTIGLSHGGWCRGQDGKGQQRPGRNGAGMGQPMETIKPCRCLKRDRSG